LCGGLKGDAKRNQSMDSIEIFASFFNRNLLLDFKNCLTGTSGLARANSSRLAFKFGDPHRTLRSAFEKQPNNLKMEMAATTGGHFCYPMLTPGKAEVRFNTTDATHH
jgi:hypothetical protein